VELEDQLAETNQAKKEVESDLRTELSKKIETYES
jgi:hypothetical protein